MPSPSSQNNWKGKKLVVLGAARQGLALARFFLLRGAEVILNDGSSADRLQVSINKMEQWKQEHQQQITGNLHWVLGEHPISLLDACDALFVSGGVPLTLPIVKEAQQRGIPLTNDSQIFMEAVPCPVVGITGSAGKTTTTTLLGKIFSESLTTVNRKVWVGGNIGNPLIEDVDSIRPSDLVLLELSSFQLELMHRAPHISAILNITPNHLDRHGTMEAYTAAKANIVQYQKAGDWAVLNHQNPETWQLRKHLVSNLAAFGFQQLDESIPQTYMRNEQIFLFDGNSEHFLLNTADIHLPGRHNQLNVLAVCILAHLANVPHERMRSTIANFFGVEHRLELIRVHNDVKWYNDSIATAPERSMAAIRSYNEPLVVLLGGRDKNLPWDKLAHLVHQRVHDVILFGEAAPIIEEALRSTRSKTSLVQISRCKSLKEAVERAAAVAQPGDVVLLSPGGTSYDEFKDFEERGERYREWVQQIS